MHRLNANEELTAEKLTAFIAAHELERNEYLSYYNQYMSEPEILKAPLSNDHKPDNRLVVNFAKHMIDTFNGYFIGIPTKVYHSDDAVNQIVRKFWRLNDMDDVMNEIGKLTSLYGRSYMFVYQDEHAQTRVAYNDPLDMFMIYSDTIRPQSLYGVRYEADDEGGYKGEIYEAEQWYKFTLKDGVLTKITPQNAEGEDGGHLYYGRVPIIEFIEDEERQSLIKPVETLINGYNKALSEKANDVDYFADAYMAILGAPLHDDAKTDLRNNRLINIAGEDGQNVTVKFLDKPNADATQENLLAHFEYMIYTIGGVTNLNARGTVSNSPASGEALKIRQQPMKNKAMNKERKFESGLNTLFSMVFNIQTNVPAQYSEAYYELEYKWTRNTPYNTADEITNARNLDGIVSKQTQLEQLTIIPSAKDEMLRIDAERSGNEENIEINSK